jgi:hypothetical protein
LSSFAEGGGSAFVVVSFLFHKTKEHVRPWLRKKMEDLLNKLSTDCVQYREATDQIFSATLSAPTDLQKYFFELLICTSQLYLPAYETNRSEISRQELPQTNIHREKIFRERFTQQLEGSPLWVYCRPKNPLSSFTVFLLSKIT